MINKPWLTIAPTPQQFWQDNNGAFIPFKDAPLPAQQWARNNAGKWAQVLNYRYMTIYYDECPCDDDMIYYLIGEATE